MPNALKKVNKCPCIKTDRKANGNLGLWLIVTFLLPLPEIHTLSPHFLNFFAWNGKRLCFGGTDMLILAWVLLHGFDSAFGLKAEDGWYRWLKYHVFQKVEYSACQEPIGKGKRELLCNRYKVSVGEDAKFWRLMLVVVAQQREYT